MSLTGSSGSPSGLQIRPFTADCANAVATLRFRAIQRLIGQRDEGCWRNRQWFANRHTETGCHDRVLSKKRMRNGLLADRAAESFGDIDGRALLKARQEDEEFFPAEANRVSREAIQRHRDARRDPLKTHVPRHMTVSRCRA